MVVYLSSLAIAIGALAAKVNAASAPGEIVCRFDATTTSSVNYYTCQELAIKYSITVDKLLELNPTLDKDCDTIQPDTVYCVAGFIQPIISSDGFCGPKYDNATCLGTDKQCCNGETWKCGNEETDCQPGTCFSGGCAGFPSDYSMDGKCGVLHGNLKCGGKWGDCCSGQGICGTGDAFCGPGNCQSGNCTIIIPPPPGESIASSTTKTVSPTPTSSAPTLPACSWDPKNKVYVCTTATSNTPVPTNVSTDSTCGGSKGMTCQGSTFGNCCSKDGYCGSTVNYCAQGCQKSFSSACLTVNVPTLNGDCGASKGGFTCANGPFDGQCCSSSGFCGTTDGHCKTGCQKNFGICK